MCGCGREREMSGGKNLQLLSRSNRVSLGGPGRFNMTNWASCDLFTMTSFSLTAVCIRLTLSSSLEKKNRNCCAKCCENRFPEPLNGITLALKTILWVVVNFMAALKLWKLQLKAALVHQACIYVHKKKRERETTKWLLSTYGLILGLELSSSS